MEDPNEVLKCPNCGGPMMVRRQRGSGGRRFFGCVRYPDCTGTRDEDGRSKADRDREIEREDPEREDDNLPSDRLRRNDRRRWED